MPTLGPKNNSTYIYIYVMDIQIDDNNDDSTITTAVTMIVIRTIALLMLIIITTITANHGTCFGMFGAPA